MQSVEHGVLGRSSSGSGARSLFGVLVSGLVVMLAVVVVPLRAGAAPAVSMVWGAPRVVDPARDGFGGTGSLSCSALAACRIVDSRGGQLTFDGRGWTRPASTGLVATGTDVRAALSDLSCPSVQFCAAIIRYPGKPVVRDPDGVALALWSAGRWSTYNGYHLSSVSCSAPTLCLAGGLGGPTYGVAIAFNGKSWQDVSPDSLLRGDFIASCVKAWCLAYGSDYFFTYTPGDAILSVLAHFPIIGDPILGISCASPAYCMAITFTGATYIYSAHRIQRGPRAFTATIPDPPTKVGVVPRVSCASPTFCVAAYRSAVRTFNGATWAPPVSITTASQPITDLSCPAVAHCIAVAGTTDIEAIQADPAAPTAILATTGSPTTELTLMALACLLAGALLTTASRQQRLRPGAMTGHGRPPKR